ncbi:hypothetical protein [Virgibacillus sp.]|nr:hypothetical protein [Virgibacillus sp.]NWO14445.1 hypothetical protein [Virgibacillus sp.]
MSQALKLSDLIDEMDMQSDDLNGFVNKKTGETVLHHERVFKYGRRWRKG